MTRKVGGQIHHVEINVSNLKRSARFYHALLSWLGYRRVLDESDIVGWRLGNTRIFLVQCEKKFLRAGFHRKNIGLNHIAFRVDSPRTVDRFYKQFLLAKRIPILYGGPKEWPEYEGGYRAVYFEDPDRIKLEAVYTP